MAADKPQFHERPDIIYPEQVDFSSAVMSSTRFGVAQIIDRVYDPSKTYKTGTAGVESSTGACFQWDSETNTTVYTCAVFHKGDVWHSPTMSETDTWSQSGEFDEDEWLHLDFAELPALHYPPLGNPTQYAAGRLPFYLVWSEPTFGDPEPVGAMPYIVNHMGATYSIYGTEGPGGGAFSGYQADSGKSDYGRGKYWLKHDGYPDPLLHGYFSIADGGYCKTCTPPAYDHRILHLETVDEAGKRWDGVAGNGSTALAWDSTKADAGEYQQFSLVKSKFTSTESGNKIGQNYVWYLYDPDNQDEEPGTYTTTSAPKTYFALGGQFVVPAGTPIVSTAWRLLVHLPEPPYRPTVFDWKGGPSIESTRCLVHPCNVPLSDVPGDYFDHFPTDYLRIAYQGGTNAHRPAGSKIIHNDKLWISSTGNDVPPHSPHEFRASDWDEVGPAPDQGPVINDKCCPECIPSRYSGCGCCDEPTADNYDSDGDGVDDMCVETRSPYTLTGTDKENWSTEGEGGTPVPGPHVNTCCPDLSPQDAVVTIGGISANDSAANMDYQKCETGGCDSLNGTWILTAEDKVSPCKWVLDVAESLGLTETGCLQTNGDRIYEFCDLKVGAGLTYDDQPGCTPNYIYPFRVGRFADVPCWVSDCSGSDYLGTMENINDCTPDSSLSTLGLLSEWDSEGLYYRDGPGAAAISDSGEFGHHHYAFGSSDISWGFHYGINHLFSGYKLPDTLPATTWTQFDYVDGENPPRKVAVSTDTITGDPAGSFSGPWNGYDVGGYVYHDGKVYRSLERNWQERVRPETSYTHGTHTVTTPESTRYFPTPGTFSGGGYGADWGEMAPGQVRVLKAELIVELVWHSLGEGYDDQPESTKRIVADVKLELTMTEWPDDFYPDAEEIRSLGGRIPLSGESTQSAVLYEDTEAEQIVPVFQGGDSAPCPWPLEGSTNMAQTLDHSAGSLYWALGDGTSSHYKYYCGFSGMCTGDRFSQLCNWSQSGWHCDATDGADWEAQGGYYTAEYNDGVYSQNNETCADMISSHTAWREDQYYYVGNRVTRENYKWECDVAGSSSTFIAANWSKIHSIPCYDPPEHGSITMSVEIS